MASCAEYAEALKGLEKVGYRHINDGWFCVGTDFMKQGLYKRLRMFRTYADRSQAFIIQMDKLVKLEFVTFRNWEDKYLFAHACDYRKFLKAYTGGLFGKKVPDLFYAVHREPVYEEDGAKIKVKHIEICPRCKKELPRSIIGYMKLRYDAPSN